MKRMMVLTIALVAMLWANWASAAIQLSAIGGQTYGNSWVQEFEWSQDPAWVGQFGAPKLINTAKFQILEESASVAQFEAIGFIPIHLGVGEGPVNWNITAHQGLDESSALAGVPNAALFVKAVSSSLISDVHFSLTFMNNPPSSVFGFRADFTKDSGVAQSFTATWTPTPNAFDPTTNMQIGSWAITEVPGNKTELAPVPEPASIAIWSLLGLGCLFGRRIVRGRKVGVSRGWSSENRQAILQVIDRGNKVEA